MLNWKIIKAVAKKELRHLKRETRMLFVVFVFPLFLLVVFGYAINLDVKHIRLAVLDFEKSKETREFVNSLINSEYFDFVGYLDNNVELRKYLDEGKAQMCIVFPKDFSRKLIRGEKAPIQILIDGVNGNTSSIVYNYSNLVANIYSLKFLKDFYGASSSRLNLTSFELEPRFWYNPELKSSRFLVPGLIGIIIILTGAITVSLSIVREKERNTIEQINLAPIRTVEFLIGKILPYLALAFVNSILVVLLGNFIFEVPLKGNFLLLILAILLYIYAAVSIGIFSSVVSDSQLDAFLLVVVISVLPSMLLSGFIFPIESMPLVIQLITNLTPAKFFLTIIRNLLLKGTGFFSLWQNYLYLLIYGSVFLLMSVVLYKKNFRIVV
jgi:ABC-2 type transport system permease protein